VWRELVEGGVFDARAGRNRLKIEGCESCGYYRAAPAPTDFDRRLGRALTQSGLSRNLIAVDMLDEPLNLDIASPSSQSDFCRPV